MIEYNIYMANNKYKYNINIFEKLNNPETIYWLGFLMADGCLNISRQKQMKLSLALSIKDLSHLKKFQQFIQTNKPIDIYDNNGHGACRLDITNKKIAMDAINLGIVPKKSLTLKFPEYIKFHPFLHHFIRGYFDGDGRICQKKHKNKYFLHFNLCGTLDFMQNILNIFYCKLNIHTRKITPIGKIFNINVNRIKDILKIKDFLYKDSCVHLERKRDIFYNFSNNKFGTTSYKKGVCFSKGAKKWRAYYYDDIGKRKEKACLKSEKEAVDFLNNLPKEYSINKYG